MSDAKVWQDNLESEISNGRKYRRILVKTHFIKEEKMARWRCASGTISTSPAITSSQREMYATSIGLAKDERD